MPFDLTALARAGAQARLAALQQEMDDLRRAFPDLDGVRRRGRPWKAERLLPRTRKGMSAAVRRAVSKRMKAYWAKRRAESPAEPESKVAAKKKRVLSEEARAKIAKAQKRRWAAVKARKR